MVGQKQSNAAVSDIYAPESYEPSNSLGNLLSGVWNEMTNAIGRELAADAQLARWELSWPQLKIMTSLIAEERPKSASHLCKSISYNPGAMTRMVDRLESKGLVRRTRCPDDRRVTYLEVTNAGRVIWPRMKEVARQVLNRILRGFSNAEIRQLESHLRRMLENSCRGFE